jgi:hypothetical protein
VVAGAQRRGVAYARFVESHPDFEYVGLNVGDTPQQARAFLRKYG